ncbi:MAG: YicC/YloC family endoribonuclease [Candidatus Binataceae bacterium]
MRSMTGFGRATLKSGELQVAVEARSLNQRFFELKLSLPHGWGDYEAEVRKLVQEVVARGRIEVSIRCIAMRPPRTRLQVDERLARSYVAELKRLAKRFGLSGQLGIEAILERPEIFRVIENENDDRVGVKTGFKALRLALKALDAERIREGASLARDLKAHLSLLEAAIPKIASLADQSRAQVVASFEARMRQLLAEVAVNEKRLHEDAAAAAQRADISEELARLRAHLQALRALLGKQTPVGKEIEFLLQEVNREVNTIGAKSQSGELSRLAVEMKGALEKMREQVQNVE